VNWISLRSEVDDDWTFNGTVPAGFRWVLRVTAPPGWATKSIRAGGRDITDAAFELGADLTDVEIVLTQRTTRVTGRVRSDRGSTAAFSTVVIAADDPQKWVPYTRFVQRTRADGAGRFTIRGLPAGRYVATAVDYLEEGEEHNPDRLARIRERGVPVILSEAESRSIDLIVTDAP
jgi:hypothetical protein